MPCKWSVLNDEEKENKKKSKSDFHHPLFIGNDNSLYPYEEYS